VECLHVILERVQAKSMQKHRSYFVLAKSRRDVKTFSSLRNIALAVFSMVPSSASSERVWSNLGFVHSKVRNRLKTEKAQKLGFLYSNLRMKMRIPPTESSLSSCRMSSTQLTMKAKKV
jgi:hypothetical protein